MKFVIGSTFRKPVQEIQVLLKSDLNNGHVLCSVNSPPPENHAVYEIMRKNVVDPDRPHMTI